MGKTHIFVSLDQNCHPLSKLRQIYVDTDIGDRISRERIELAQTANGGIMIVRRNGKYATNPKDGRGRTIKGSRSMAVLLFGQGAGYTQRRRDADPNDYRRSAFKTPKVKAKKPVQKAFRVQQHKSQPQVDTSEVEVTIAPDGTRTYKGNLAAIKKLLS